MESSSALRVHPLPRAGAGDGGVGSGRSEGLAFGAALDQTSYRDPHAAKMKEADRVLESIHNMSERLEGGVFSHHLRWTAIPAE